MNIVKGVAGLLRKTSIAQAGENRVGSQVEGFSTPPWPEFEFGRNGNEAILESEWERYETTLEKEEKEKALEAFLSHFLQVFQDWRPDEWQNELSLKDAVVTAPSYSQGTSYGGDTIRGCFAGHPTRVILALILETKSIVDFLTELQSIPDSIDPSPNPAKIERGLKILDTLRILTRSIHNQRVFSYYGGLQTLVALMKAAVVQLKALTSAVVTEESLPYSLSVQLSFLKCLLAHVISVVSNFIDTNSHNDKKDDININDLEQARLKDGAGASNTLNTSRNQGFSCSSSLMQRATVPLMETGGLNWFVELLQVLRRLRLKNQMTEMLLEQLTLRTLKAALIANPRAQNHFRSIGGPLVLIDGLDIPSWKTMGDLTTVSRGYDLSLVRRTWEDFQLQILSLEVLREAVYGNFNCLQFIFENGGIKRFANTIHWAAFILPQFNLPDSETLGILEFDKLTRDSGADRRLILERVFPGISPVGSDIPEDDPDTDIPQGWNIYVAHLSKILLSFLVPAGDLQSLSNQLFDSQDPVGVSVSYLELATKWILRVFISVFPSKMSQCDQEDIITDPRILSSTLQRRILYVLRKILTASPTILQTFREEGVWNLLFSEYFFYFKLDTGGFSSETVLLSESAKKGSIGYDSASKQSGDPSFHKYENLNLTQIETIQMEVISFVEFAATLNGCGDNLPECSALMDAFERCACLPQIATMLVKSLHRILQLATDPTVASFKHLDATTRFSEVIYRQMQGFAEIVNLPVSSNNKNLMESMEEVERFSEVCNDDIWSRCMESVFALFAEYFSVSEDAKVGIV